jgi:hypothetical protein
MHGEYKGVKYGSFPPEPLHYELEKVVWDGEEMEIPKNGLK